MITCRICGFEGTMLGRHIRSKHNITPEQYLEQFPGAILTDKSLREKMSNSNALKGKTAGSLEDRFGVEKAQEIKRKIGERSGASRKGKARPQQAETIRKTWETKREEWSQAIKDSYTPERRQRASDVAKALIAERGVHLPWGKSNMLESFVDHYFTELGFQTQLQYLAKCPTANRYFDIFVPDLNMLVECDGEYWHSREDRITVDREKNQWAIDNGFTILRISDSQLPHRISTKMSDAAKQNCIDAITARLDQPAEKINAQSLELVESRVEA